MKQVIFFILLPLSSSIFGQTLNSVSLNLTDEGDFLGTERIPDSVQAPFFTSKLGSPNRIKKGAVMVYYYDSLGISLYFQKATERVILITYNFMELKKTKKHPMGVFQGNFYINSIPLNKNDSQGSIKEKLPKFKSEGPIVYQTYSNNRISFIVMSFANEQDEIFEITHYFMESW